MAQRLHMLTAFVVVGIGVWFATRALATPSGRRTFGFGLRHLLMMFAVQVALGVEAYLGKFALTGPEALKPPELRAITSYGAVVRTAHTLLGAALLSTAVALAVRAGRGPVTRPVVPTAAAPDETVLGHETFLTAGAV